MKSSMLKKLLLVTLLAICGMISAAEDYLDCIRLVNQWLDANYRNVPYAYKAGCEKLAKIIGSDKSEEEQIAELKRAFPRAFAKEEKPLIVQQPVSWNIHSLSLGYDIKEGASSTMREVDILKELEGTKTSVEQTDGSSRSSSHHLKAGAGANIDADAQANFSLNPFKWLKSGGTIRAGINISGSYAYNRESASKSSELWSESQQQTVSRELTRISEIISRREIAKLHLTFELTVTNNTDEDMTVVLNGAYIPVYMGKVSCNKHAEPYGHKTESVTIGARGSKDFTFRMELDTTTARKLVGFMCQNAPTIDITRGFLQIKSNSYQDAVAQCRTSRTETRQIKLRLPVFDAEWNIRCRHTSDQRPVTLREALTAIDDDINFGWRHHILTWRDNTLAAISDITLSSFAAEDKDARYHAFLQVGDKVYSRVPVELLDAPLPGDDVILWVVDLKYDYKNIPGILKKAIVEKLEKLMSIPPRDFHFYYYCFQFYHPLFVYPAASSWCLKMKIPRGHTQEFECIRKLSEQGYAPAQTVLGLCYQFGWITPQSKSEAKRWYAEAANHGDAEAQCLLGLFLLTDSEDGGTWLRKAAEQGYAPAQYLLGVYYLTVDSLTVDRVKQAVSLFYEAAKQGFVLAQLALGFCYEHGFGVKKDPKQAVYWYQKAAEQGHASAQFNLGVCYANGTGVEKN